MSGDVSSSSSDGRYSSGSIPQADAASPVPILNLPKENEGKMRFVELAPEEING